MKGVKMTKTMIESYINRIQSQNYGDYGRFYKNRDFREFAKNAKIPEEIIDAEAKHEQVVDIILSKIISYLD